MQFKVPQNIDMEDKIVGPLTMVQFVELIFSLLVFYASLRYGGILLVSVVGVPVLLIGLALAFVKIQDQPFSHFAFALLQYILRPKYRVWKKDPSLEKMAIPMPVSPVHKAENVEVAAQHKRREETRGRLDELTHLLDTQGEKAVENNGGITALGISKTMATEKPTTVPINAQSANMPGQR